MKKDLLHEYEGQESIRLNRFLSDAGVCSRREADRLIEQGKVTVDDRPAQMGMRVTEGQIIKVNGRQVERKQEMVLLAVNKPRGIVCTTDRKREKDNIVDFVHYPERIYPVGRLDKDSEGLILMTNDGTLVNHILKASEYHEKEYIVTVDHALTGEFLSGMAGGVEIPGGMTRPCTVTRKDNFTFSIILTQGLNRQIRYMCEHFGYRVIRLQRVRVMNIRLGHLKSGAWRKVTPAEIEGLKKQIAENQKGHRKADEHRH